MINENNKGKNEGLNNKKKRTWDLCSGVDGGFGVVGSEPPAGVQCRSRARAVRSPSVTRLFYCFLASVPRVAASLIHLLARCSLFAKLVFSLRSLSWMHEIHPLSLAAGMMTRVGVERFTNPLPRATDCAARRLSTVTFTIAHLNSRMRPDSPFYSFVRLLIYLRA